MKRYDIKIEIKIMKALSGLLKEASEPITEEEAVSMDYGVMDCANVCMVVPLSEEAKRSCSRFKEKEGSTNKIPQLEYGTPNGYSKYSSEYLKKVTLIFDIFGFGVYLETNKNYPLSMSNSHFKVIIAPRVDND